MFARFFAWLSRLFAPGAALLKAGTSAPATAELINWKDPNVADLSARWPAPEPTPLPDYAVLRAIIDLYVKAVDVPAKGVKLVPPDSPTRDRIAHMIIDHAARVSLPMPYLAACICQESAFAPDTMNRNLLGKNPTGSDEGTDWGIAQISGRTLATLPEMVAKDWPARIAMAKSELWAIPYITEAMRSLVVWAQDIVSHQDTADAWAAERELVYAGGSAVDPNWQNAGWLATLAYNRGRRGALEEVASGIVVTHPQHVSHLCNAFCDALGRNRIMPDSGMGGGLNVDAWR